MRRNEDIRFQLKKNNIYVYEIAEKLACHENTIFRMLRKTLTEKQQTKIYNAISEVLKEKNKEGDKVI